MRSPALLLIFALAAVAPAATIDQYLSGPFASGLSAAPSGGKVIWLLNERGARNIWAAAAPDYKGRRLTNFKDDDGQEIGEIAWTVDGKSVVFVRGGDLETNGDNPNPRSLPQSPEMAVWLVPFDGGAARKLGEGRSPAVSKDGQVAVLRNGQIFLTNFDGGKPNETLHTTGRPGDRRWS